MNAAPLVYSPLIVLAAVAAVCDLRTRRIPNWISFSLIASGVGCALLRLGPVSVTQSAIALAGGLLLGVVLLAIGAWGAGDAKLVAGIGAWIGVWPLAVVLAVSGILSMLTAIVVSAARGKLGMLLRGGMYLGASIVGGQRTAIVPDTSLYSSQQDRSRGLPLAVVLFVAVVTVLAAMTLRHG